ncbi:MAG: dephospho-CoA kinase, partial [Gammaproteobacteria bacterium]|nr:dephospho-CoA kinase [Gammaproteobacteria bacterium]
IDTPLELQVERAKKRDETNTKAIQKIIDAQASQQERLKMADDVLVNEGDLEVLAAAVKRLREQYTKTQQIPISTKPPF